MGSVDNEPEGTEQVDHTLVVVDKQGTVSAIRSSRLGRQLASTQSFTVIRAEVDSHADTCVLGKTCLVIRDWGRSVRVSGWNPNDRSRECKIVTGVVVWDRPEDGQKVMLIFHQALYCPDLDHHLICPLQLRQNGLTVNETQKQFVNDPTYSDHAITCVSEEGESMVIPLEMHGSVSYFPARAPTPGEWGDEQYLHVNMTSEFIEWDPEDEQFAINESSYSGLASANVSGLATARGQGLGLGQESYAFDAVDITSDATFGLALEENKDPESSTLLARTEHLLAAFRSQREAASRAYVPTSGDGPISGESTVDADAIIASLKTSPYSGSQGGRYLGRQVVLTSRHLSRLRTSRRVPTVDSETLAKRFDITPEMAKKTLDATTARGVRTDTIGLYRRVSTNDRWKRYPRMNHVLYTDTMYAGVKSWQRRNKCAQLYATDFGWVRAYPMEKEQQGPSTLDILFKNEGVPDKVIGDFSKMQTRASSGKKHSSGLDGFKRKLREAGSSFHALEGDSQWGNAAETRVREAKRRSGRMMVRAGCPLKLWDHALEHSCRLESATAKDIYKLNGQVPETMLRGDTFDISELCQYGFYDWIKFREPGATYPDDEMPYGRYLGPIDDVGSANSAKILQGNGQVVVRSTFRGLFEEEVVDPVQVKAREAWDKGLEERLGAAITKADIEKLGEEWNTPVYEPYADDFTDPLPDVEEELPATPDLATDVYLGAHVSIPRGGVASYGKVKKRVTDSDGNPLGRASELPLLDSRRYVVEFDDGDEMELTANVIAERMYASIDEDGNDLLLLDAFVDYRRTDEALTLDDQFVESNNGVSYARRSTAGWEICVKWTNGSTSWEKVSDLKESYPVELAEFAIKSEIDHEPAFNWWVRQVLKRRDRIVSKVKSRAKLSKEARAKRYNRRTQKFGIEVPRSVEDAVRLDKENGNTLWQDAIAKEMKSVRFGFRTLKSGEKVPVGFKFIRCHMIFDVKMEDFRRKARLVAGGHMTEVHPSITYASVVTRETVRIALTLASLNNLGVMTADIQNAFIKAPCTEKVYTTLGPEFGEDAGKTALIVRALYGLKSSAAAFRNHLGECMRHMGYAPCLADPDLWMKPAVRESDGHSYYEYVLLYVDDVMAIGDEPRVVLEKIDKYFGLKPGSLADPNLYLGAKVRPMTMNNGQSCWGMSASQYVQEAVKNVAQTVKELDGYSLPKQAVNPFPMGYEAESDVSPELAPELASEFQSQVGILRWIVELGRVDIITEVSNLASQLALPRQGHLEASLHIFAHLRDKHNARLALDPTYPDINRDDFEGCDWKRYYGDVKEAIPPNMPPPRGKEVDLRMYVDSDHAGEKKTRRSRTGFFIFLNSALIQWLSKKQPTIETSVFGAEFVALKNGMECLRGLRYKLRMMGVPISGPSYIYGDNMSVIKNTQTPESTLNKKSNAICYHFCRESVAMGESLTAHIPTNENVADLATKVLYGEKRRGHVRELLRDLYDEH